MDLKCTIHIIQSFKEKKVKIISDDVHNVLNIDGELYLSDKNEITFTVVEKSFQLFVPGI